MHIDFGTIGGRAGAMVLAAPALVAGALPALAQDAAYEAVSRNGLYSVTLKPELAPLVLNTMHNWNIVVTDIDGAAVDGATIAVEGGMPAHGHGLPTAPEVTAALGGGRYLLEGVKFSMSGVWVLDLAITAAAGTDHAIIQVPL